MQITQQILLDNLKGFDTERDNAIQQVGRAEGAIGFCRYLLEYLEKPEVETNADESKVNVNPEEVPSTGSR
jgi:hypothetical protein